MATHLKVGDKAPDFKGRDQNNKIASLKHYKGKKLIVYFYPEDDTPTCTIQASNLRDNYSLLQQHGFEILGISPDDIEKHQKFESKYNLPFRLIADPEMKIIKDYGVWGEKNLYGRKYLGIHRTTFIIDETGKIVRIFLRPKNKSHAEEIINSFVQ